MPWKKGGDMREKRGSKYEKHWVYHCQLWRWKKWATSQRIQGVSKVLNPWPADSKEMGASLLQLVERILPALWMSLEADSSSEPPQRNKSCQHLNCGLGECQAEKQWSLLCLHFWPTKTENKCVVLSCYVCGSLLQQQWKTKTHLLIIIIYLPTLTLYLDNVL